MCTYAFLRLPAVFLEVLWFPTAAPQKHAHNTHCDPDEEEEE